MSTTGRVGGIRRVAMWGAPSAWASWVLVGLLLVIPAVSLGLENDRDDPASAVSEPTRDSRVLPSVDARPRPTVPAALPAEWSREFDGERAYAHLRALVEIGPRPSGSEGAARARDYIREQLAVVGADVVERTGKIHPDGVDPYELVHIAGVLPGNSSDVFLLAAPYDTFWRTDVDIVGANDGGSGPALLLELARVLSTHDREYSVWFVFIDGNSIPRNVGDNGPGYMGSHLLASIFRAEGGLDRMRLGFFFNKVADPDLHIARDLRSYRSYREIMWRAAQDLDLESSFPSDSPLQSPQAGHRSFIAADLRRVVAVIDKAHGGDESPGLYWGTGDDDLDHTSAASLQTVGVVTLETLARIQRRLAKIDRFVSPRRSEPEEAIELDEAVEASELIEAAEAIEVTEPVVAAEAIEVTEPVIAAEPVEAAEPVVAAEAAKAIEPTETVVAPESVD